MAWSASIAHDPHRATGSQAAVMLGRGYTRNSLGSRTSRRISAADESVLSVSVEEGALEVREGFMPVIPKTPSYARAASFSSLFGPKLSGDSLAETATFKSDLDLYVQNECASVLHADTCHDVGSFVHLKTTSATSLAQAAAAIRAIGPDHGSSPATRRRLASLCDLTSQVFSSGACWDLHEHRPLESSCLAPLRRRARWLVRRDAIHTLILMMTIWVLVGPDILLLYGFAVRYTNWILSLNTVVLSLFFGESVMNCLALDGYTCSARFWIDIFSSLSLVGDTWIGAGLVADMAPSTSAGGKGGRLARVLLISGRSMRLLRIWRSFRIVQVLRVVPWVVTFMEKSRRELALILVHKRLWRIFKFLDEEDQGKLPQADMELFTIAMEMEFPRKKAKSMRSMTFDMEDDISDLWVNVTSTVKDAQPSHRLPRWLTKRMPRLLRPVQPGTAQDVPKTWMEGDRTGSWTFRTLAEAFIASPEGEVAIHRCELDLKRIKDSCTMLKKASTHMALKICGIVLCMVFLTTMLSLDVQDKGDLQALTQLTVALGSSPCSRCQDANTVVAGDGGDDAASCALVREFVASCARRVVFLALGGVVQWADDCPGEGSPDSRPANVLSVAGDAGLSTGLQPHELLLYCPFSDSCADGAMDVALFDMHRYARDMVKWSLAFTGALFCLIVSLVVVFSRELNKIGTHVLYPLWDLLDDMSSLRSFEVVCLGDIASADVVLARLRTSQRGHEQPDRWTWARDRLREWMSDNMSSRLQDANELADLRRSFSEMHAAIRAWTKFVPPMCCMQLFNAGVEATIAVQKRLVTILFCDLDGFRTMCTELDPSKLLGQLNTYHQAVCEAIELHEGTLLEFIEDELVAVFNAPTLLPCHEEKAITAAVELQEQVSQLLPQGSMRVGVHTAQVLVGNLGSPTRIKYGMLGDGVNTTARLKSLNSKYGTRCVVSGVTLQAMSDPHDDFLLRPMGNLVLKGRTAPIQTWEVLGMRKGSSADLVQLADLGNEAYQLFLRRHFTEARRVFVEVEKLAWNSRHDKVSKHFIQLCDRYATDPPPPEWDGVEWMDTK